MSSSERDCVLAIVEDQVVAVGPVGDASTFFARDPDVTEVVRMPIAAARFPFEEWPGRVAALARLAEEAERA